MRTLAACIIAIPVALAAGPAVAADLLQHFRDAQGNDAVFAAARASAAAAREKLPQGKALLLPTVSATANTTYNDNEIRFRSGAAAGPFGREYNSNGWTVSLSQPLYRRQNWLQLAQAEFQVAQAEALLAQAGQDLIVRVAQQYFDVLGAQDSLAFIEAQKAAIAEQLAQAKRNFEVGTATITDTHEAQARFDLVQSQEIASRNDIEIRKRALQQTIGSFPEALTPLRPRLQLAPPQPESMDRWVETALTQNYAVRIQDAAVEVALREIERSRAGHLPTLDLVATHGRSSAAGSVTSGVGSDTTFSTLGLQLALPIYAGGAVDSKVREALANRDKALADQDNSRRQAALAARQAYLGVTNGMAQVRALEQALVSSETALASNKLGYEVGVRINIDVLNAQQQVFSTKRDLAKARYDTLMAGLKLKAAAGTLGEMDVEEVNRLLGSN